MRYGLLVGLVIVSLGNAQAATYSIAPESVDIQKVYYGSASGFEKAGKVDYEAVIMATDEYEQLSKKKVRRGTGKYWILLSKASERAVHAIGLVGRETEYDFIAAQTFLDGLESGVPSEDVTQLVLDKLDERLRKSKERTDSSR